MGETKIKFMRKTVFLFFFLIFLGGIFKAKPVLAHENYVLTKDQISADLADRNLNAWDSLKERDNLNVALSVGAASFLAIILYFFFQLSAAGRGFDDWLGSFEPFGHVVLRVALSASLIASAHYSSFLGPEIPLSSLPLGGIIKFFLYVLGALMFLGLWSEITGALSLVILLAATFVYKDYILTYFNYFGEFIALLIFGSRVFSLDKVIYGAKQLAGKYHDYELALIRITYGISVMYPAITLKLLHPAVIVDIVNRYHLTKYHWLFPHDPLLASLGGGLAQAAVGLCLIFGFETRLNTLITFGLMFLSVLYFKEAVWPHYVLLALALYLFINNGGKRSLDGYFAKRKLKSAR
jgi:hypothetical protein